MNLTIKPKYIPLFQKPNMCAVTCLQMVLYRRGYGLFDQQELARFFKVKIRKDEQKMFNVKFYKYKKDGSDEGMKTIESEKIVNRFFKKNKILLKAKAIRASEIDNLGALIMENLKQGNDLWVEFKSHKIHKKPFIHDNLIESMKEGKPAKVIAIDPGRDHKPRTEISIKDLGEAISDKYGRETGFLIISKK